MTPEELALCKELETYIPDGKTRGRIVNRLIAIAVERERESCAKLAESYSKFYEDEQEEYLAEMAANIALAIRERK